jgi:hypothetical protein
LVDLNSDGGAVGAHHRIMEPGRRKKWPGPVIARPELERGKASDGAGE